MGRKRRKIIRKTVKPPPSIFVCPLCNHEAVSVVHEKGSEVARVTCGFCKVSKEVHWYPSYTPVDAYAAWYDIVTKEAEGVEAGQG
ncbi:MAG: transcription elongation factor 1 family protein [Aigarchaeota archaeon]|nr:transcription elongation factor 1 family protein [Aigarchaeota archaeon]